MSDYQYLNNNGLVIPDTSSILSDVENEFKAAFGDDLIVTPDTPQGVLIAAETTARKAVVSNNAALANQINPDVAGGVYLDAIWALMGGQRTVATRSVVAATVNGVPGAIISAGVQAKTTNNDLFELVSQVTISDSGSASAQFQSVEYGPVPCPAAALTTIVDAVIGWETVTNDAPATLGKSTQSDVSARRARRNTLAKLGQSLPEAITSALYSVDGVTSLSFRENVKNTTETIDGIALIPHSIYVCVDGGTDADVAAALLDNKTLGAGWNGDLTVATVEPASGQPYDVKFSRPTYVPIIVRVTVKATAAVDPQSAVRAAIVDYASGNLVPDSMWGVGDDCSPWELAGAINQSYPGIYVTKVELSKLADAAYASDVLPIEIWERATINESSIVVVVT